MREPCSDGYIRAGFWKSHGVVMGWRQLERGIFLMIWPYLMFFVLVRAEKQEKNPRLNCAQPIFRIISRYPEPSLH